MFVKRAILFDLDGVLIDSKIPVERSWRAWAKKNSLDVDKVIEESHGRRTIETVRMFTPHLDAEAESAVLDSREAQDLGGLRVVPGAKEVLAKLPRERWAVVTSGTNDVARTRLRAFDFPEPRVLVSSDNVSRGKPDPDPYLQAAAALGYEPADCLVIEDTPAGIESARRAGMSVIGLTITFPSRLLAPDVLLADLTPIRIKVEGDWLRITCE